MIKMSKLSIGNKTIEWVTLLLLLATSCHGSSNGRSVSSSGEGYPLAGVAPDRFVAAAPLIVAAVCSDGVAVVATHTAFRDEPLLLDVLDNATVISNATGGNITEIPKDLPKSFRGPFRIHTIDGFGTCMVCAGWRADGQVLVDYCRSVASSEVSVFGEPTAGAEYGRYIASDASLWMAQNAAYMRALSCVALLASCGKENCPGYLWLLDCTGAYQVKAHAVGGSSACGKVNQLLATIDFSVLTSAEGVKRLLEILADKETSELPSEARVEIAIIGAPSSKRRLQRLFSSSLFGVKQ